MKQHLKTKVLDDKALRLSASSCRQHILYSYATPPCKRSYKKELILNLKVLYIYCKSFIIVNYILFTDNINIYDNSNCLLMLLY